MKLRLTILFLLVSRFSVKADYAYMHLSNLICEADYGAIGTIVKLDKNYFYLKVEAYLLSRLDLDTLKIQRFESWPCGSRYDKYEVGQRELVFFRKSNYVIEDYDLLGYGAGAEFELPIKGDSIYYNASYDKLQAYSLSTFQQALKDYDIAKQKAKEPGAPKMTKQDQLAFSSKSELHKLFITCEKADYSREFEVPKNNRYIANLEKNHLYENYENKVYVSGFNINTIDLQVEDAAVWKKDGYFIVKPKDGWSRRWLNIYAIDDKDRSKVLYNQLFDVLALPTPQIYFGNSYRDTIFGGYEALPRVAYFSDKAHQEESLDYELLSYTYEVKSGNAKQRYKIKSANGTPELRECARKMKSGDQITVSDIYVLYPDKTVKQIPGRTVILWKEE